MAGAARKTPKKPGKKGPPSGVRQRRVNLTEYIQEFDALIRDKKITEAQEMLDRVHDFQKWQRLNLQALIEMAKNNEVKAEAVLRSFT